MKIKQTFIKNILIEDYPSNYALIYDKAPLIQYLDKKTGAVNKDTTARRNLANLYAIYSITHFYSKHGLNHNSYTTHEGFNYSELSEFTNTLYGGAKLQNHGFNNRVIGEFRNKTKTKDDLFIINDGRYKINPQYLFCEGFDLSQTINRIIEKFIDLIKTKDEDMIALITSIAAHDTLECQRSAMLDLISQKTEARVFEILTFAVLKNYYKAKTVYFGSTSESISEHKLNLYRTGRTNANDGGIDYVLTPLGKFFQVTEVTKYEKYFLDIDKVMHYPITFVIKTSSNKEDIKKAMIEKLSALYGDDEAKINRYLSAIDDIITLEDLKQIVTTYNSDDILTVVEEAKRNFQLEMNIDFEINK